MGRENKKQHVAAVHRETILAAAERLFLEKGVSATTIEDISKQSQYSRRTLYAYYESKEDILHQIILKSLHALNERLIAAIAAPGTFTQQYWEICQAMTEHYRNSPQAAVYVMQAKPTTLDSDSMPKAMAEIFEIGIEINRLLAGFIEQGKESGVVQPDVVPMQTVYVLWSCISAVLSLVQTKGSFLEQEFQTSQDDFLAYSFKQIINSILVERLSM